MAREHIEISARNQTSELFRKVAEDDLIRKYVSRKEFPNVFAISANTDARGGKISLHARFDKRVPDDDSTNEEFYDDLARISSRYGLTSIEKGGVVNERKKYHTRKLLFRT